MEAKNNPTNSIQLTRLLQLDEWGSQYAREKLLNWDQENDERKEFVPDNHYFLLLKVMTVGRKEAFTDDEINLLFHVSETYASTDPLLGKIVSVIIATFKMRKVILSFSEKTCFTWNQVENSISLNNKFISQWNTGIHFSANKLTEKERKECFNLIGNIMFAQVGVSISGLRLELKEFPCFFDLFHSKLVAIHFENCEFIADGEFVFPSDFLLNLPILWDFKWKNCNELGAILTGLQKMPATLSCLDLSYNQLSDEQLLEVSSIVKRQTKLIELILNGIGMTNSNSVELVRNILQLPHLRNLDLSSNQIGEHLLERLAASPTPMKWTKLDLEYSSITDYEKLIGFKNLPDLHELALDANEIKITEMELRTRYLPKLKYFSPGERSTIE